MPKHGFTVVEILVAMAILVVLGALLVPAIVGTVDRSRVESAEDSLEAIAEAILLFADRVNEYPASLTQLVVPISGADTDICGATYTGGERNRWAGPYLDRALPDTGVPVGVGTADNALGVRADPSRIDYLQVVIREVVPEDARALDERIDGGDGPDAGALRWAAGADLVTAYYLIPFPDC